MNLKRLGRYMVISALIAVSMLGIPLIFPFKAHPYTGKSVSERSGVDVNA